MRKTYISVYTCAFSRAVHLNTPSALSAEAFIQNFRRFAARRGLPWLTEKHSRQLPRNCPSYSRLLKWEDFLLTMESSRHSIWRGPRGGEAFF